MKRLVVVAVAVVLAMPGCQKNPDADRPKEGEERGDCYREKWCDDGLMCLSNTCVRPPPADCNAIAAKVGNQVLNNYTPHSERAEFINRVITDCMNAKLSKWDGDCILRAKNRLEMGSCPVTFGLGSCDRMVSHMLNVIAPQDDRLNEFLAKPNMREQMLADCERKGLTKAQEACVLKSRTTQDVKTCGID